jgi:Ran GTPase-activating protein (RanGAP) involved in mRNA processing and transport
MKTFLKLYLEKCEDYAVKPKKRLVDELTALAKRDEMTSHLILNGNCVAQFSDRLTDIELFPLCEVLENDIHMVSLDMSYNIFGDQGAEAVNRMLQCNKVLKHLSLRSNQVHEKGAQDVAKSLTKNRALLSLDLSENEIGDKGGLAIAQALQVLFIFSDLSFLGQHYIESFKFKFNRSQNLFYSSIGCSGENTPFINCVKDREAFIT